MDWWNLKPRPRRINHGLLAPKGRWFIARGDFSWAKHGNAMEPQRGGRMPAGE